MADTYVKKLSEGEYNAVFSLGSSFDGTEGPRFAATKINEKISEKVRDGVTKTAKLDEKGEAVKDEKGETVLVDAYPKSIEVTLTRAELDGYFIGIKETVKKSEVKSSDIALIGNISKSLGMSARFKKYSDEVLASVKVEEEFDVEVVDEPLDGE